MNLPQAPELDEYHYPPRCLRAAGALWIASGVLLILIGLALFSQRIWAGLLFELVLPVLLASAGVYLWRRGLWLGRGADARTGLLVVGLLGYITVWPALLVATAVVLQTRPAADRWFTH
ncbi:hypothetical protein [Actinokineospora fastidiosa]|uniref:Uncharacterized protein n=1 Tax=Actinokineospora fastidiosa TaxID=1816 RepID=A0A918GLV9_9PSEU|nr:hypothetical protein [Actinokineospora fastidiosa]GGS43952.1 hypothetical protein GCM10010171_43900 [Actinokineospora fastidiosa]